MQQYQQDLDDVISTLPSRPVTPSDDNIARVQFDGLRTPVETCDAEEYRATSEDPTWPSGWRPWLCLFGCFLLMFDSWGLVNAYGTFASYYSSALLEDEKQILLNLIGSTESFIVLLLAFVTGRLLDAHYGRYLLVVGATLITAGMFGLSGVGMGDYGGIWASQGLTVGLGMSCFFVSSSQSTSSFMPNEDARLTYVLSCRDLVHQKESCRHRYCSLWS